MNQYDKGFARPASQPHGGGQEREPASTDPINRQPASRDMHAGQRSGPTHGSSRLGAPIARPRRWQRHAGRVGGAFALLGLLAGLASLAAWGNWAAVLVLPLVLGFAGWMAFLVLASIADAFRRVE